MVVAGKGAGVFVFVRGIPEFYREVLRAGCEERPTTGPTEIAVGHRFCVALERVFMFSQLPIPDFESGIIGAGGERGEYWVEGYAIHGGTMGL